MHERHCIARHTYICLVVIIIREFEESMHTNVHVVKYQFESCFGLFQDSVIRHSDY